MRRRVKSEEFCGTTAAATAAAAKTTTNSTHSTQPNCKRPNHTPTQDGNIIYIDHRYILNSLDQPWLTCSSPDRNALACFVTSLFSSLTRACFSGSSSSRLIEVWLFETEAVEILLWTRLLLVNVGFKTTFRGRKYFFRAGRVNLNKHIFFLP